MGNVQDKLSNLGDKISQGFSESSAKFKTMVTAPKEPLPMPQLFDGRSADELRTSAEMMYNMDTKTCINIAFLGASNDGKLALINSMRYINDCVPDCGTVSPKNLAVQYTHCDPGYKHLRFWDVKDASGTFQARGLYAFDAVVLLITEVLREGDVQIIKEAAQMQPPLPIILVRAGMDAYVDREFAVITSEKDVVQGKDNVGPALRDAIKNQLIRGGVNCPFEQDCIYLISAPGLLAARAVNFDGTKYIWDEFDYMKRLLDIIGKRRY